MSIHIIKADKIITGKDLTLMTHGAIQIEDGKITRIYNCLLYTSPSPRDRG